MNVRLFSLTLWLVASCGPAGTLHGDQSSGVDNEITSGIRFLAEAAQRLSLQQACAELEAHCLQTGELCGPLELFCSNSDQQAICLSLLPECQDQVSEQACLTLEEQCLGQAESAPADQQPAPEAATPLDLELTAAIITLPFVLQEGALSQPVWVTDPQEGGRAAFPFFLPQAGSYVLQAEVAAPDEGSNSFFLNIDAEPQAPAMIWDVPLSQGFAPRTASWRGNGDALNSELAPKVFSLSAGAHQLLLRGREGKTRIRALRLQPWTEQAPPQDPLPPDDPPSTAAPISGALWYVDNAASGGNNGRSWADAWQRFAAIDWSQLQPGDALYISGGNGSKTYRETLTVQASGTAGRPISILRAPDPGHDGEVIIDGEDSRSAGISVRPGKHLRLSGFTLRDHTSYDVYISGQSGSVYSAGGASSHVRVEKMSIKTKARGVFVQTSDRITVANCTIVTPSWVNRQTDGIYSQRNQDNVYDGNQIVIYNAEPSGHDDCIQLYQDTSTVVRNNYLGQVNDKRGNAQGIYATTMHGTTIYYNNVVNLGNAQSNGLSFRRLSGSGTVEIYGNTVYSLRAFHTAQVTETPDPIVKNNIFFTEQGASALDLSGWSGDPKHIDHNLYWTGGRSTVASLNGSTKSWSAWQALGLDAGGLSAAPQVLSADQANFKLQSSSPAISAGLPLGAPYDRDKDGVPRPQGGGWDLGAYER